MSNATKILSGVLVSMVLLGCSVETETLSDEPEAQPEAPAEPEPELEPEPAPEEPEPAPEPGPSEEEVEAMAIMLSIEQELRAVPLDDMIEICEVFYMEGGAEVLYESLLKGWRQAGDGEIRDPTEDEFIEVMGDVCVDTY